MTNGVTSGSTTIDAATLDAHRHGFDRDGFVQLKGAIHADLLAALRQGLAPLLAARDDRGDRPTRYQTILEPAHFHPSFAAFLDLALTNETAAAIIGTDELMLAGLACLLGCREHVICRWHRDTAGMPADQLAHLLNDHPNALVQTNCAVYDDVSLWVVPGSHRRGDTPEEEALAQRTAGLDFVGPIEAARALDADPFRAMPGSINVQLKAGDCLLYNPLLWHAAEYRPEWTRCTLHGGWKDVRLLESFDLLRWGLTHNPWLQTPEYLGPPGRYLGPQLARYNEAAARWGQG